MQNKFYISLNSINLILSKNILLSYYFHSNVVKISNDSPLIQDLTSPNLEFSRYWIIIQ